jgi:hypothetical protein
MTCRGYDSKTVKVSKTIKRGAATIIDPQKRGAFIRSYVAILQSELATKARGPRDKKESK